MAIKFLRIGSHAKRLKCINLILMVLPYQEMRIVNDTPGAVPTMYGLY